MRRLVSLAVWGFGALGLGCPADDAAEESGGSTPTESTVDPESGSDTAGSTGEPGTSSAGESDGSGTSAADTDEGETTSGQLENCDDAATAEQCNAISNEYSDCLWYETTLVTDTAACASAPGPGACVNHAELDGCANPDHGEHICDGSEVRWWYAERDDGWEFFQATGDICGNVPTPFQECYAPLDPEGMPDVAAACACACSLLE